MEKFFGLLLLICGFFFLPIGVGIPIMIQGARLLNK